VTIFQALAYFLREAVTGLVRSLRVSVLAIFTIAVSLFLSGALFGFSQRLARTVADWRSQARLVIYLEGDAGEAAREAVRAALATGPFPAAIREVPPEEAARRFARSFPSLAEVVASGGGALPFSFELALPEVPAAESARLARWLESIRDLPPVDMVDADEDWIGQMETLLALVRGIGLALTAILIAASVFTIASVVRLTSFLYRDEIAVMRLVGATEFYIRGPFYVEGILQGLFGGALAVGALAALDLYVRRSVAASAFASFVAERTLSPGELALLVLFGALAGWLGAVVSLGRESLQPNSS
jgi:cell division transport system permease protein